MVSKFSLNGMEDIEKNDLCDHGLQWQELILEYYVKITMQNATKEKYTPITNRRNL